MDWGKLTDDAKLIVQNRYSFSENENWKDLAVRCGRNTARIEKQSLYYEEKFIEMIYNMDFLPGGRILRNIGRIKGSLFNCFVLPLNDSIKEIGEFVQNCLMVWASGGGIGTNVSFLRPHGSDVKGVGGVAAGPIKFLTCANSGARCMDESGQRRAAGLALMLANHPDVIDFIDAKMIDGLLNCFNISIGVTEDFIEAIEKDKNWDLTFNHKVYKTIHPREIWNRIIKNMVKYGEPGLINWNNLRSNNSYYFAPIYATNPCIIGNSILATADGRNGVSVKQLAEEGKNIPLYSCNKNTGKIEIKIGRSPRKTGNKVEVWKLILDDGSEFISTPDHKIITKTLEEKKLKDLIPGEPIKSFNSYIVYSGYRNIANSGKMMKSGYHRNRRQYRLIYEFYNTDKYLNKNMAIHHKDFDNTWDFIGNLELITSVKHRKIHSKKMEGKNNPYHRMTDEWKRNFASKPGEKNGMWSGISNEKLIEYGKKILKTHGKLTKQLWKIFCVENNISCSLGAKARFGSWKTFKNLVIDNHKVVSVEFYGYEDVYNITVDDNHNYIVLTSYEDDKFITSSGICVKNCGETPLEPNGICDLGSIPLMNYISNVNTNWKKMEEILRLAVRFLDNIIDINNYILNEFEVSAHNGRRIGIGVMGLADYLFAKQIRYGSKKSIYEVEKLIKFIRDITYDESIKIATEKGSFPKFDPVEYGKAHFIRSLPASTRMDIKKYGIRNVTLMAMAPTGTISLLPQVTSGIEPLFLKAYKTNDNAHDRIYVHPIYKEMLVNLGQSPDWFVDTTDLKPADHLEIQAAVQKYTDGAVSKTINMKKGTTPNELSDLLLEYIHDLKGVTVYVDGTREDQPLVPITDKNKILKYINDGKLIEADEKSVQCAKGNCNI